MALSDEMIKFVNKHRLVSLVLAYVIIGFIEGTTAFILKPDIYLYLQGRTFIGKIFFYFYFILPSLFLWPMDIYFSLIYGGRGASLAWGILIGLIVTGVIITIFWIKETLKKED